MIADGKCQVIIDTEGMTVRARWWDVWQAIEATVAVCIMGGKGGSRKLLVSSHPPVDIRTHKAHDTDLSSQAFSKHPMVGLYVSIMDEPTSSRVIGVSAEVASGQGALQSEMPRTFAGLENPETLTVSLVRGLSPRIMPSQIASIVAT